MWFDSTYDLWKIINGTLSVIPKIPDKKNSTLEDIQE